MTQTSLAQPHEQRKVEKLLVKLSKMKPISAKPAPIVVPAACTANSQVFFSTQTNKSNLPCPQPSLWAFWWLAQHPLSHNALTGSMHKSIAVKYLSRVKRFQKPLLEW
jgi:hypothetical protein